MSRRLRADIVVNNLVGHAVTTGKVLLQSDGSPWRPLVHIADIAQAFARVLDAPREVVHDQAFNVGRVGENYRIREVANLVAEVVPELQRQRWPPAPSADRRDYRVDFSRIERELPGFQPQWTLRRGIEELYEAYASGVMTPELFNGPRYFRSDCAPSRGVLDIGRGRRSMTELRWAKDSDVDRAHPGGRAVGHRPRGAVRRRRPPRKTGTRGAGSPSSSSSGSSPRPSASPMPLPCRTARQPCTSPCSPSASVPATR